MNTNHQQLPSDIDYFAANRGARYKIVMPPPPLFAFAGNTT